MDKMDRRTFLKASATALAAPTKVTSEAPERVNKASNPTNGTIQPRKGVLSDEKVSIGSRTLAGLDEEGFFIYYRPPNSYVGLEFAASKKCIESSFQRSDPIVLDWWEKLKEESGGLMDLLERLEGSSEVVENEFTFYGEEVTPFLDESDEKENYFLEDSGSYVSIVSSLYGYEPEMSRDWGIIPANKFDLVINHRQSQAYIQLHDRYSPEDLLPGNRSLNELEKNLVSSGLDIDHFLRSYVSTDERILFKLYSSDLDYEVQESS